MTLHDTVTKLGQRQLLDGIEHLPSSQLQEFHAKLKTYGSDLNSRQKQLLLKHEEALNVLPYQKHSSSGNADDRLRGEEMVRQGKVGCLILAGGQGTRLGFDGPKGLFPVTSIRNKSLFQLFCERTQAAGPSLPLCIMTSPINHAQTVAFFNEHRNFGLDDVTFIQQGMLPFVDDRGNWLLEKPGKIAEGPDGNGHALNLFFKEGIWEKWKASGVEYLNVIFVDNPLADPFDAEFAAFTMRTHADVAVKAVQRLSPDEKMGVLAERNGKLQVIEYSELPKDASAFTLSYTGMLCFSMEFIQRLNQFQMPLHLARKSAKILLGTSKGHCQEQVQVWKCETFLFDVLQAAAATSVLLCPRDKIYAPLKNASGDRSITTVKQALQFFDHEVYHALTGRTAEAQAFELDPAFYYPTPIRIDKLRNYPLREGEYVSNSL